MRSFLYLKKKKTEITLELVNPYKIHFETESFPSLEKKKNFTHVLLFGELLDLGWSITISHYV